MDNRFRQPCCLFTARNAYYANISPSGDVRVPICAQQISRGYKLVPG